MIFNKLKIKELLIALTLLFSPNAFSWKLFFDSFLGFQYFGSSVITFDTTDYYSRVRDFTYGFRFGSELPEASKIGIKWPFKLGLEFYQGNEFNLRDSKEDTWSKSNIGLYFSLMGIRGTYYFSPEKKLITNNHTFVGALNDKATGEGFGIGTDLRLNKYLNISLDYRNLIYSKIGDVSLPKRGYVSKLRDHEFVVGLSSPLREVVPDYGPLTLSALNSCLKVPTDPKEFLVCGYIAYAVLFIGLK